MFTKLINALLSAFGIVPDKKKKFTTENNPAFLEAIEKPGTICLIGGDGFLPNGIQGATDSFWCHTFVITEKGWCAEAEANGIERNRVDKYLLPECQMVAYQTDLTPDQLTRLLNWIRAQIGKPYGYLDFLTQLLPDPSAVSPDDKGFICSALAACGYAEIGILIVKSKINPHLASPKDLNDALEPNLKFSMFRFNW